VGVVSLSQGTRPSELARGLASVLAQRGVALDIVVVGNGWTPSSLPVGVKPLSLTENLGIPAGRNRGAQAVAGEYLLFLDDDASIPSTTFLADVIAKFTTDPTVGLIQPRVVDPSGIDNPRRWIPRIRKGSARTSSNVFSVWEGAVVLPRSVFDATGGWAEPFFYAHEGIELAWRVWDQGKRVLYAGDLVANHPAVEPTRHEYYHRLNARNRVWLAKRNLPWLIAPIYVASWTSIQLVRCARQPAALRAWFGGWLAGWRQHPSGRKSIKWVTVWRMTLAGRPPLV